MLDRIRSWSTFPFNNRRELDVKLVRLLLVRLVGMANVAAHNVDDDVRTFIKGTC